MANERPVGLSTAGPPETVMPPPPELLVSSLAAASTRDDVTPAVAQFPTWSLGWAALGDAGRDDLERYAAYRVGYHRGLDLLRQSGWRGSGYVRWAEPSNRGFLRCLLGLKAAATAIDERDEVDRLDTFIDQMDPSWDRNPGNTSAEGQR